MIETVVIVAVVVVVVVVVAGTGTGAGAGAGAGASCWWCHVVCLRISLRRPKFNKAFTNASTVKRKDMNGPLSSAEVQAFVISIRCAKCTAGAKSNGSSRRRTSARICRFLVRPCRFLVHRWISRLWLHLTA